MRLHDVETLLKPSGRPLEFAVGLVVACLALLFLFLAGYVIVVGAQRGIFEPPIFERGKLAFLLVPVILLAIGIPAAWVAFRLLSGRRRPDGGLLPPAVLRIAGVVMVLGSWVWLIADPRDPWRWGHTVSLTTAGIACWALADRRHHRDSMDAKISEPTSKPVD